MKLLKSSIFAVLAFATAALTGCSDDDSYSVGANSPGAYFPEGLSAEVRALTTSSVYEIPVYRTSASDKSEYSISYNIYPACDGISIPSTISFSGDDLQTSLNISYDADNVDLSQVYDMVITIADASAYGKESYTLAFQVGAPLKTVAWDGSIPGYEHNCTGKGTYTFNSLGETDTYQMYKVYDDNNPHSYSLVITDWLSFLSSGFEGVTLTIEVPDDTALDEYGTICVRVPEVGTGFDLAGDDCETMVADYAYATGNSKYEDYSYYDPEAGTLHLALAWYSSASGIVASAYDSFQLDGFPDYTVSADYLGLYTNPDSETYAIGSFSTGDDVASAKAALVETTDETTALNYVLQGGENVVSVTPGTDVRTLFRVYTTGNYSIAIVTYDSNGDAQSYAVKQANIDLGNKESDDLDWTSLGSGQYIDGWWLPLFLNSGYDYTSFRLDLEIQQNKNDATLYRLVNPYTSSDNLLVQAGVNEFTGKRNIEFSVEPVGSSYLVSVRPQACGFQYSGIDADELYICNYEGFNLDAAESEGESIDKAELLAYTIKNSEASEYDEEEGIVSINTHFFEVASALGEAYYYNAAQPSYVIFPEASAQARHKLRAKAIAKPKLASLAKSIKMRNGLKASKASIKTPVLSKAAKATARLSHAKAINAKNGAALRLVKRQSVVRK